MLLNRTIALTLLIVAGCFSPKYDSGEFQCGSGAHACPDGYHCAADNKCWKLGSGPDMLGGGPNADLLPAIDMALPPPLSFPPAAVWISSGGGILQQPGVAEIDLTISAEFAVGTAATGATPSPTIMFGYFSSLTN